MRLQPKLLLGRQLSLIHIYAAAERRAEVAKELADMKRDYELAREEFYKKMRKTKFFGTGRILKSYPDLRIVNHGEIVDKIKETLRYKTKS